MAIPLWQRFVSGGAGPELTLAEAAAALGVSVQTVRRMVQQGKLHATRTANGRLRIVPGLKATMQDNKSNLADLWRELKRLSELLRETRHERDALKAELAALQARMEAAIKPSLRQPTLLSFARNEAPAEARGHETIQSLILAARRKSKRRLWLWRLTA